MNHLHRNLLQHCDRDPLRMNVARYCDRSLYDDRVAALRNRVLDALNELDVRCAPACRMNELDAQCALGVMCALAYRMNELAYQMCALREAHHRHGVDDLMCVELGDLMCDALDAHCALLQTLLRETLASRPIEYAFRR